MRRETVTTHDLMAGQLEIIDNNGVMISPTELIRLIKTAQIPLIDPARLDERRYCSRAIAGEVGETPDGRPASACGCASLIFENGAAWCSLNGAEVKSPCVFDEPENSPVWVAIRAYVVRWG